MFKKFILFLLSTFIFIFAPVTYAQTASPSATTTSSAKNIASGEVVRLEQNEVVDKDYFAWGEKVEVLGTVNGDVYIAGGNLVIDGVINGDLLAAGGDVDIKGQVTGNVRVVGGDINVSGEIGRNITVVGGSINLEQSGRVGGSLVAAGGEVDIQAPVEKEATFAAGDVILGGSIGNGVLAGVSNLTLASDAKINGDLVYWSNETLTQNPGSTVSGKITHNLPRETKFDTSEVSSVLDKISAVFTAIGTLSYLLIGLLFIRFFPGFSREVAKVIETKPFQSLGIGLLAIVLTPIIFILLLVTVIGIPLSLILLFGFFVLLYISKIFVALFIGQKLLEMINRKTSLYLSFIVGILVYQLFAIIPGVGIFVSIVTFFIGLGAVLISKKQVYQSLRSKEVI